MGWKDTKVTQVPPQKGKEERAPELSHRPKSAIEQIILEDKELRTVMSVLLTCKPQVWKSCLISQLRGSCADMDQHLFKIKY